MKYSETKVGRRVVNGCAIAILVTFVAVVVVLAIALCIGVVRLAFR